MNTLFTAMLSNSNVESALCAELLNVPEIRKRLISILLNEPSIVSEIRAIVSSDPEKFIHPEVAIHALDLERIDSTDLADLIARAAEELNSRI